MIGQTARTGVSKDGAALATASWDKRVIIWLAA